LNLFPLDDWELGGGLKFCSLLLFTLHLYDLRISITLGFLVFGILGMGIERGLAEIGQIELGNALGITN
jgi:hypothetical protein